MTGRITLLKTMNMPQRNSRGVKEKGKSTYERILEHPFIQELAAEKDKQTLDAMTSLFLTSLQYEYDFWDYGYYGEDKRGGVLPAVR